MTQHDVTVERWPFACKHCGHIWETVYERHRYSTSDERDVVSWRCHGLPSSAPWDEAVCPRCSGMQVEVLPPGAVPAPAQEANHGPSA